MLSGLLDDCPPPGLESPLRCRQRRASGDVGLSLDSYGIARLVSASGAQQSLYLEPPETLPTKPLAKESAVQPRDDSTSGGTVVHGCSDGVSLADRINAAVQSCATVIVDVVEDCVESELVELSHGEVYLRGVPRHDRSSKVRLTLPGFKVTGGILHLTNLHLCATQENTVQMGQLRCVGCYITSRGGCGVLCLQRAKVHLENCEVVRCLRSGMGVNGKGTEIEIRGCDITQNNFSGVGVNHQARSLTLSENRIRDNGYHGVWLNTGVVARWLGGELSGNKLTDKDGDGLLIGFDVPDSALQSSQAKSQSRSAPKSKAAGRRARASAAAAAAAPIAQSAPAVF